MHRHGYEFNAIRANYWRQPEKRHVAVIDFERNYGTLNN